MVRWKIWWRPLGVGAMLFTMGQGLLVAQCEMCKTGLTNSPEGARLIDGFRSGILMLMITPYLLVGALGLVLYSAHRRRTAAAPRDTEQTLEENGP